MVVFGETVQNVVTSSKMISVMIMLTVVASIHLGDICMDIVDHGEAVIPTIFDSISELSYATQSDFRKLITDLQENVKPLQGPEIWSFRETYSTWPHNFDISCIDGEVVRGFSAEFITDKFHSVVEELLRRLNYRISWKLE